jgi:hypothetical protein
MDNISLSSELQQKRNELKSLRRELFNMGIQDGEFGDKKKEHDELIEIIKQVNKEIYAIKAGMKLNKENFTKNENVLEIPKFLRTFA